MALRRNDYVTVLRGSYTGLCGTVTSVQGDMAYVDIAGVGVVPIATTMLRATGKGEL